MSLLLRLLPQSRRILTRVNTTVHKVDGPNQGQTYKSTKWTDPTKGQTYKSTKRTDLTRVKLISPRSGRIPPRVNTVHKVDGPNQGQTYKSTKWTDPTKGQHGSQIGRTQPGSNLYKPKKWTDPTRVKLIQL